MQDQFVVTRESIEAHCSGKGGWTAMQLCQIDVKWPPTYGWKGRACGLVISAEQKAMFENGQKTATKPSSVTVL